ncbi:MAG: Hsp70 family protein [Lachnospiraceae bacterium]|nr:Hsp70 family protein [Lachnospiraceae bacterium]
MGRIIGIDLGTTNSLVCVWEDGKAHLIPNSFEEELTPSVVGFGDDGTVYVGKVAKERLVTHPDSTFESFKRYMGQRHVFECTAGKFTAEELSAFVLRSLKADAERYLGEPVTEAVISVPAYFDDKARNATKNAGVLAGLTVERIINEPSAAALGYIVRKGDNPDMENFEEGSFLIFDFGGGTLDVSLVDTFENIVEIVTVSGNNMLGGIDFDRSIADYFLKENGLEKNKISGETYRVTVAAAERVKRMLSEKSPQKMVVNCEELSTEKEISDLDLARICAPVLQSIYAPVNNVLRDSGRTIDTVTDLIMVGGSSKMPVVQQYLKHLLRRRELDVFRPDTIVAEGMGAYAGIKERKDDVKDMLLTDVCPFSLGTNIENKMHEGKDLSSFIIMRNSPLPISRTNTYYPTKDNQTFCNFKIFQGEEMYADDNKRIGLVTVNFPKPAMRSTKILLTFTYDINGILLVNADVPDFNIHLERVILEKEEDLASDRVIKAVDKLKNFKSVSENDADNKLVMEWGERLYAMLPPGAKEELGLKLQYFDHLLSHDPYQAVKMKKHLKLYFVALEVAINSYTVSNWQFDEEWEDEEDNEMERLFKEWESKKDDD